MERGYRHLTLVALLATLSPQVHAAEPCQLARVAEWPVRLVRDLPIVEGSLNGRKAGILLDTGAYASLITRDAAQRLDLWTRPTGQYASGVGGDTRVDWTNLRELRITDAVVENMRVRVAGERPIADVDFILGDDFFRKVDVEFDYPKGVVRIYSPSPGCRGSWLGYWDPNAIQVPLEGDAPILLPVKVNGRAATALLDSGASSSVLSLDFAAKIGLRPDSPGVVATRCTSGIGARVMQQWIAPVESLSIGAQTIRDAKVEMLDLSDLWHGRGERHEMILGTDFLKTHRVYVSRHQGKMYFTHAGGLVFRAAAHFACDERVVDKDAATMGDVWDKAIAGDPRDIRALLGRASLRNSRRDFRGAVADADAVLAIEPNNAAALYARANGRAGLQDFDGAMVDSGAAIANGIRTAEIYVNRSRLRSARGDHAGAIAELDDALKLDPRDLVALRLRGMQLFHAGRYEAAEQDFMARLAVRRNAYDAIWVAMARARLGKDGSAVLAERLAETKGDDWPEPILRHMLGRLPFDPLMASAAAQPEKRAGRECEARYYAAEKLIEAGRRDEARPLLEAARDQCPRDYVEYTAAVRELARQR